VLDHILDLVGVENRKHDRFAVARDIGKRAGAPPKLHDTFGLFSIDIEAHDAKTRCD
jgi:hypothetical protein